MRALVFPYKVINKRPMPIIPVVLYGSRVALSVEAFVDSGATISVFSYEIAEELNLSLESGRELYLVVGDGGFIPSRVLRIPLRIGDEKFVGDVAFSQKLNVGFNLLGRKDVFEHFQEVAFRERAREVWFRLKRT